MEKMNDLKDLLRHEVMDIASAEQQIIDALPAMIEKASNSQLKNALQDHLRVTQEQKIRLEKVQQMLEQGQPQQEENPGLLSRLFKSNVKCAAMKGILEEGRKMMGENMNPEVMDAAIIACAQKVEHYEITSYGTVRTWARELGLEQVARLLEETLNEEYHADDLLTMLAESRINKEAETGEGNSNKSKNATSPSAGLGNAQPNRERATRRTEELEPVSNSRSANSNRSTTPASGKSTPAKTSGSRTSGTATRGAASKTAGTGTAKSNSTGRTASGKTTSGNSRTSGKSTGSGRSGNSNSGRNKSR